MPVTAPTSAFILAVYTARAGHRSGKIAVIVSEPLLLATIVVTLLYGGWIGLAVTAVVAVLVLAWTLSRRIAVVVSGLLLLATLVFSAWQSGGWIECSRDRHDGGARGAGFRLGALPQQTAARAGRCAARGTARGYRTARRIWTEFREFTQPGPIKPHTARASQHGPVPLLFEDDHQACQRTGRRRSQ